MTTHRSRTMILNIDFMLRCEEQGLQLCLRHIILPLPGIYNIPAILNKCGTKLKQSVY